MQKFFTKHKAWVLRNVSLCIFSIVVLFGGAQAVFLDVDTTHPYFHAIDELEKREIVKGHALGSKKVFSPRETINRVEALKMILLSAEVEISDNVDSDFPDVKTSDWFFPYVSTAFEFGVVKGFPDGTFRPASKVTRAEFLKILSEAFGLNIEAVREGEDWYSPYFELATNYRLLPADSTPHGLVNRGEAAEIIYRTLQVKESNFTGKYTFFGSGKASYYNEGFAGRPTANGEIYDPFDMTAAHRTLPFGTRIKVYNENKDFIVVRINDRGPYHKSRILDLSEAAFSKLAPISTGVIPVRFEVFSDPQDEAIVVPEQIRPQLSTEIKTSEIPDVIKSVLSDPNSSSEKPTTNTQKIPVQPVFKESVGVVGKNFFPGIELRETFPEKVPLGYVFRLKGRVTSDENFKEVVVFMQNQTSGEQIQFRAPVSGKNFAVPVSLLTLGTYDLGVIFDDQRESKVAKVEVVNLNRERRYSSSDIEFSSDLEVEVIPEKKEVSFRWASDQNRLTKMVFTQEHIKRTAFFVGGMNYHKLPYSFFESFEVDKNLAIDVFQAQSEDGSLDRQFTNWKKVTYQNFKIVRGFPDYEVKAISIRPFERYKRSLSPILYSGKILNGQKLNNQAFITRPNGEVQSAEISVSSDDFRFSFIPQEFGTYIVEVISEAGEILFNRAVYVEKEVVLPVYPREQTVVKVNSASTIIHWVNRIRDGQSQAPLLSDVHLKKVAQDYAKRMAEEGFISHVDPEGKGPADRVESLNLTGFAENLSYGSNLNLALAGLENSGSHRKNIISSRWTRVGIGLSQDENGDFYVVQIFSK